jgi:hypothetical protein
VTTGFSIRPLIRSANQVLAPLMKFLPLFAVSFAFTAVVSAEPPQHIDVDKLPGQATLVDNVVVPVPSEIFSVLDKLGSPNWHEVLRPTKAAPAPERAQTALLLGTVIAEGFIAVEAQEGEEVKKIGRAVLKLAAAIGVQKSVIARSNAIIEGADKKEWVRVRTELDGAQQDVKRAMTELQDEQLAQLVSLGGWLRGTEALTAVVKKNFSHEGSELLHQPTLLEYFNRRLAGLDKRLKSNEVVGKIEKRLPEIKPLIGDANQEISSKAVDQINEITSDLVKSINSKVP